MSAFILQVGPRWNEASLDWAVRRLSHRGPATRIEHSRQRSLLVFGEPPRSGMARGVETWSWGLDASEHEGVLRLVEAKGNTEDLAIVHPSGLVLLHLTRTGEWEVHRGVDWDVPILHARRGRSLFMAPEAKAFSNLRHRSRILPLPAGSMLRFEQRTGALSYKEAVPAWQPLRLTELGYEEAQEEVARLLEEGMSGVGRRYPGPIPIALSGGLDSSIVAWLADRAGVRCEAFTVWFDSGPGDPPPDLIGARRTAEAHGIPLTELRIGREDIEELARRSVYLQEEAYWRHVETGTYVLRLVDELKRRGYRHLLNGLSGDGNFAGMVFPRQLGERFQEAMASARRLRFALSRLGQMHGVELVSPFDHAPLAEFSLRLPQSYLVEEVDGRLRGKKILRDLYAKRMASPLASEAKDFPFKTSGIEALFEREWGTQEEREERYGEWMKKLLAIPTFRGESAFARVRRRLRRS